MDIGELESRLEDHLDREESIEPMNSDITDKDELEAIRERDKEYSHWVSTLVNAPPPEMTNEEVAMLDRHILLAKLEAKDKLLAEGREIVFSFTQFQPEEQTEEMFDEAEYWRKKVKRVSELNELIGNGYIWTPAAKIRAAEADLIEARNVAGKYYRLYQGTQEEILLFQESESYDAKRARDLIAELKEALEQIENWKEEAHHAGKAHKKVQKKLKSMGLKWHNDKVDRNKKLKEAQERIAELEKVLDAIDWVKAAYWTDVITQYECPWCGGTEESGHLGFCMKQKVLQRKQ